MSDITKLELFAADVLALLIISVNEYCEKWEQEYFNSSFKCFKLYNND